MADDRRNKEPGVQPIELVVRMIDALERSVERLQTTIREDFASQAEVENVKLAVQGLREEVANLKRELVAGERLSDTERKLVKWFLWVGIPGGALAVARFAWDYLVSPYLKSGAPKP